MRGHVLPWIHVLSYNVSVGIICHRVGRGVARGRSVFLGACWRSLLGSSTTHVYQNGCSKGHPSCSNGYASNRSGGQA